MRGRPHQRVAAVKTARLMLALSAYEKRYGAAPTIDTLRELAGLRSHANAAQHVNKLVLLGLAARPSRNELYLTDAGRDLLRRVTDRKVRAS